MVKRIKSFGKLFIGATLFALAVRLFLLEDYRISSSSMFPSLFEGDLVFISKSAFNVRLPFSTYEVVKFKRPEPGEIVAFTVPDRGIETFVKRVVAVEGDKVQIKDGVLTVNDQNAGLGTTDEEEKKVERLSNGLEHPIHVGKEKMKDFGPIDVPKGHFFVLGDNRNESVDSRTWGPVPYSCLKGRLGFVWLSIGKGGELRTDRIGLAVK